MFRSAHHYRLESRLLFTSARTRKLSILTAAAALTVGSIATAAPANAADNPTALTFNESSVSTNSVLSGTFKSFAVYGDGMGTGSCGGNPSAIANLGNVHYVAHFTSASNPNEQLGTAFFTNSANDTLVFPFDGESDYINQFELVMPQLSLNGVLVNGDVTISRIDCYAGPSPSLESLQTVSAPAIPYRSFTAPSSVEPGVEWSLSLSDGGANPSLIATQQFCGDYADTSFSLAVVYSNALDTAIAIPEGFDPAAETLGAGFATVNPAINSTLPIPTTGLALGNYDASVFCLATDQFGTWIEKSLTTSIEITAAKPPAPRSAADSALAKTGPDSTGALSMVIVFLSLGAAGLILAASRRHRA